MFLDTLAHEFAHTSLVKNFQYNPKAVIISLVEIFNYYFYNFIELLAKFH
ncbi:MAG: hypothetical protein MRECE_5c033 [Mycoplasmataceae bacterium CE_OT135]|nr:MAG: hypothetical protein MRECE_6c050 [Mycoplasmataceae bacterium CE_OT135]KLL03988.1 MAG: hypothetical protein MRECE_5c033 [Mycoplasmataceae bacterium CE_OT135]